MKNLLSYIIVALATLHMALATHNRAGEITFRHISGLTYEFTVTTFTYEYGLADRDELPVDWGDNTSTTVMRNRKIKIAGSDYFQNTYIATHTFPGPGVYKVLVQDPNRNFGVENIPNSVNVVFSITTTLVINPIVGNNNSPVLLNPPKDQAALGRIFIHNPSAYDPDGDSLSYKLTVCTGFNGNPITNYTLPRASDSIYVNPLTGDLVWDSPLDTGKFNIAMIIEEWRNGAKIGSIVRDMQIEVFNTTNNPPINPETFEVCIEAGKTLRIDFTTTDADNDRIVQYMSGLPFEVSQGKAGFTLDTADYGLSTSIFNWVTSCSHVQRNPYQIVLRSEDINNDISLVDIDNYFIRVIAPPPVNLEALATSNEITITWEKVCPNASRYAIYRRMGRIDLDGDSCQWGVPVSSGYSKVGETADTLFTDGSGEEGLMQGVEYCYVVTALFDDGAESYPSEPVCISLVPGVVALTQVSVTNHSENTGSILLSWVTSGEVNTQDAPGPYVYIIYRSLQNEQALVPIDSFHVATLVDSFYVDTPLNTLLFPYYYTVRLFNNSPGNRFEIGVGFTELASSLYSDILPDDNRITLRFRKKVPWVNTSYIVYRQNHHTLAFDSVGFSNSGEFIDRFLQNNLQYCYKVISEGWRPIDTTILFTSNVSHINCGIPADITPPCPPGLSVVSVCDSSVNIVTWTNPNNSCTDDVIRYNIYYSSTLEGRPDSLTSTFAPADTTFRHLFPDDVQILGCYFVTAIDSFENESMPSVIVCVDECYLFELPNVFTPNNDGVNDYFMAYNQNSAVKNIELKIYNRWGLLVYETQDPDFMWDGTIKETGRKAASGVYYYICDVYEPRLNGIQMRNLVGFVHLFAEEAPEVKPRPE